MQNTIWIINQYASHLENRHLELAKAFAGQGYRVAVITSSFHHGKREYLHDEKIKYVKRMKNVAYVYLHSGPGYTGNGGKRILNMLDFCRLVNKYQKQIRKTIGKPKFVIASSAPPFVWETGYKVARKNRAKFIAEFRDIWPMSLIDVQGVSPSHPLVKVLDRIEERAYRRADAVVSTMPFAWKHVMDVADITRDRIHWMANGINVSEIEESLRDDTPLPENLDRYLSDHWCGVYIGSIVKSECLDYLLSCISKLDDPDIWFAIIGEGHEKESVQELAEQLNLSRVKFFPAIDKKLIPKVLNKAQFCMAAHENLPIYQYGLSMNKLNDYLASGVPTIFACDAESIVREAGHFSISMGDESAFVEAVRHIRQLSVDDRNRLREDAQNLIRKKYDYPEIGKRYLEMMETL